MSEETVSNISKTAVLLVNLGSPDEPTPAAVRRFLKAFLWDPRVVNIPRVIWWLILHLFVLTFRPRKSAKAYQKVWTPAGSPLVVLTQQLTAQISTSFDQNKFMVDYAMSYCEPSIESKLKAFKRLGINKLVVLPLYPQFSSTTSASVHDSVVNEFKRWKAIPSFSFISTYCAEPLYIAALAESIKVARQGYSSDLLIMSFHGLPAQLVKWGDPYCCQCHTTAALLAAALGLAPNQWRLVFQSRFGKAEWLKPYCVDTLMTLPQEGIKRVDVVCPGFAVDCLETLEEIAMENKAIFMAAGGEAYHYIPALNTSPMHVEALVKVISDAA